MKKKIEDLKKVAKREKTFSTLAKIEGKGAAKRQKSESKSGLKESAKDSAWETKIDKNLLTLERKNLNYL